MYERVADLSLHVEDFETTDRTRETSSGFTRRTTTVALHGDGEVGRGEDVTYEPDDHDSIRDRILGPPRPDRTAPGCTTELLSNARERPRYRDREALKAPHRFGRSAPCSA